MSDGDLTDLFARQDGAVNRNGGLAGTTFALVDEGLRLGLDTTLYLNEGDALARRMSLDDEQRRAQQGIANLLHASWASLVSATRLALFGAQVDSFALTRGAFEATYHAEFFRLRPETFAEWDAAGLEIDLQKRARLVMLFARKFRVRSWLAKQDGLDREPFFVELSTFGSHANPMTVGLRVASPEPGVANLGFMSLGKPETIMLCASHALHVTGYMLSEFTDSFDVDLRESSDLWARHSAFQQRLNESRATLPSGLSLLR